MVRLRCRRHLPYFEQKRRKAKKREIANALNMRLTNLEEKPKEQIKQRHACRCRARGCEEEEAVLEKKTMNN